MDWLQVASLFLANAGLIFWFRSESRSDWRHSDAKMEAHVKTIHEKIDANQREAHQLIQAIHQEIKDFHGRLCAIEERNKKD